MAKWFKGVSANSAFLKSTHVRGIIQITKEARLNGDRALTGLTAE